MAFTCNTAKWDAVKPPGYNATSYCNRFPYYTPELMDIRAGLRDSMDPMMQASLGLCGTPVYLGAGQTTSPGFYYCAIVCLNDTVINTLVVGGTLELDGNGALVDLTNLMGKTLPAGTQLLGNYASVGIVSGLVKCMPHPFL